MMKMMMTSMMTMMTAMTMMTIIMKMIRMMTLMTTIIVASSALPKAADDCHDNYHRSILCIIKDAFQMYIEER